MSVTISFHQLAELELKLLCTITLKFLDWEIRSWEKLNTPLIK